MKNDQDINNLSLNNINCLIYFGNNTLGYYNISKNIINTFNLYYLLQLTYYCLILLFFYIIYSKMDLLNNYFIKEKSPFNIYFLINLNLKNFGGGQA